MGEVDRRLAELAARQEGVVALRQLRGLGISDAAVRVRLGDRRMYPLFRGVFVVGQRYPSLRGRWKGATLALGDDALLSHRDAAVLLGLANERRPRVDVTAPGRKPRPQPGIRAHRIRRPNEADRAVVDGIPVTSVARTLLDHGAFVDCVRLRRMYARAERSGVLELRAIDDLLGRSNGHKGRRALAGLLAYDPTRLANADSELERRFVELLEDAELPPPLLNVLVEGHHVDAHWPAAGLVVELDGFEFHRDREAFERDRRKLAELRLAGYEAIAFTWRQIEHESEWVIETVRQLHDRGVRRQKSNASL